MSNPKFTPGPWYYAEYRKGMIRIEGNPKSKYLDPFEVCSLWRSDDKASADGRLIAAAPAMYQHLRDAAQAFDDAGCEIHAIGIREFLKQIDGE